jgi:hypothetical protein
MTDISKGDRVRELLAALSEQLAAGGHHYEFVIVGGSALLALELVDRTTQDVDVVALRHDGALIKADPLPRDLIDARNRVANDFALPEEWLNPGPSALIDFGLPEGFLERVSTWDLGAGLTVHFVSRLDQIHLKLYALVDQGIGKHEGDLRALVPSQEELIEAARWTRTHDPSPGFREMLEQALRYLGVDDADLGPQT